MYTPMKNIEINQISDNPNGRALTPCFYGIQETYQETTHILEFSIIHLVILFETKRNIIWLETQNDKFICVKFCQLEVQTTILN